jgi:diguanylate cyclase (GGDEF)-like protein
MAILIERRGSMYDPWVVDTFLRVHKHASTDSHTAPCDEVDTMLERSNQPRHGSVPFDEISSSAGEMLTLYELARALGGQVTLHEAADIITKHLRHLIPSTLTIFFIYDSAKDELVAQFVIGVGSPLTEGLRIGLGQRLSGWVAANRQTIANSDARLDLGDAARSTALFVTSCISTPMLCGNEMIGVLSMYSPEADSFTEDHRRIIEAAGRQIAPTFKDAIDNQPRNGLTRLPPIDQLEQFVASTGLQPQSGNPKVTLLVISIVEFPEIRRRHGQSWAETVLQNVAARTIGVLRLSDVLFRLGSDDLVALLNETDGATGRLIGDRVHDIFLNDRLVLGVEDAMIRVSVSTLSTPDDGRSFTELVDRARAHSARPSGARSGVSHVH